MTDTDQPAPAYLDPLHDELDRLRTDNAELRAQVGGSECLSSGCTDRSVWPYLCETHLTEAIAEEDRRIEEADKRTDVAEARVDQLTDQLALANDTLRRRGDAVNATGTSNDALRAKVAAIEALLVHLHTDLVYAGDIRAILADQEPAKCCGVPEWCSNDDCATQGAGQ